MKHKKKLTTARLTGLFYLGLAVTGAVAFLFVGSKIYVDNNAATTAANIISNESLVRIGIAMEVALVAFQALAAVWFYKLFKKKNSFAASLIAIFGMVNAIAIQIAAAVWLAALNSAVGNYGLADSASSAQLLFGLHQTIWLVSGLFFGLWLIPMGYMVLQSKMPKLLGWILILGGIGYVLSTFVALIAPEQTALIAALPVLATVGEFWMIGYLLFKDVKF